MKILASEILADWTDQGLLTGHKGPDRMVTGIAPVEEFGGGDLLFIDKLGWLEAAKAKVPACIVTTEKLASQLLEQWSESEGPAILITPNLGLAQARLRQRYVDRDLRPGHWPRVHDSAVIHETVQLGDEVVVGPNSVIEAGAVIGAGSVVLAGSVIEHGAVLGKGCVIHPNVTVGYDCRLGNDVIIHSGSVIGSEGYGFAQDEKGQSHRVPQLGVVVIEDRVRVGACNCIDRAAYRETRIGAGTKLDNHCHVAHNVKIGRDCLLTAGLIVAGSTTLGDRVIASGDTGFIDHLTICDDAVFVHKAGVIKDVTEPGVYAGTPIQPLADYTRNTAAGRKLNEMRLKIRELEKKLAERD